MTVGHYAGIAAAALFLIAPVWGVLLGRSVSHADRNRDREQSEAQPVSERPTKILVISNHGGLRK